MGCQQVIRHSENFVPKSMRVGRRGEGRGGDGRGGAACISKDVQTLLSSSRSQGSREQNKKPKANEIPTSHAEGREDMKYRTEL